MDERRPLLRFLLPGGVAAILALGIFFRVTHLQTKVYWHDEVYTSLWLSGFDPSRKGVELFDGREVSVGKLLQYQRIHPARGLTRTIRTLARNDSQHPPFYYALAWLSARFVEDSTTTVRALSALFGLLLLPAMYWLCAEAYGRGRVAWLGTLLIAVSPVHLVYAHEAREYSLWALFIVLATAALLRARRVGTWQAWSLYGLTAALGLYAHGLFPLVLVAHGGWALAVAIAREREGDTGGRRMFAAFAIAGIAASAAFAPWAWIVAHRLHRIHACTDWLLQSSTWGSHWWLWFKNLSAVVIDDHFDGYSIIDWHVYTWLRRVIFGIGVGSLLISWRYRPRNAWLLAFLLIAVPLLVLGGPDLLWGGQRSTQGRFLFPCYVGVTLATVHFLAPWLQAPRQLPRLAGHAVAGMLLVVGTLCCASIWRAESWWNKGGGWRDQLQAIRTINDSPNAVILSGPLTGDRMGHTIAISHLLDPRIRLRVISEAKEPTIPSRFRHVYFINVSEDFVKRFALPLERMGENSTIWRYVK